MLGAVKACSVCSSTSFERTPGSRATQCTICHSILEERARSFLPEYSIVSMADEVHCAVTPDLQPDDERGIPSDPLAGDPFSTPGFISAFRMLSPLQEPVYGATAGTMCGDLAEMERLLAETLDLSGEKTTPAGVENSGSSAPAQLRKNDQARLDPRHMVVAYFEIVDLADVLDVDRETVNLAVRLFEKAALSVSMRNKHIEALAASTLPVALQLRHLAHTDWLTSHPEGKRIDGEEYDPASVPPFPANLTISRIAVASGCQVAELERDMRIVRAAVSQSCVASRGDVLSTAADGDGESPPLNRVGESVLSRVNEFTKALGLDDDGRKLCSQIVENALSLDVCPRRAPISVAAAGIYLGTQILGLRFTQAQVCRVLHVTEVTLRKVYRELSQSARVVVPEGRSVSFTRPTAGRRRRQDVQSVAHLHPEPVPCVSGTDRNPSSEASAEVQPVLLRGKRTVSDASFRTESPARACAPGFAGQEISPDFVLQPSVAIEGATEPPCESKNQGNSASRSAQDTDNDSKPGQDGAAPKSKLGFGNRGRTGVDVCLNKPGNHDGREGKVSETFQGNDQTNSAATSSVVPAVTHSTGKSSDSASVKEPERIANKDGVETSVEEAQPDIEDGEKMTASDGDEAEAGATMSHETEEAALERQKQIMMSMIQNPAMVKAFASAMAMLPAFSAPPPPPPLPTSAQAESRSTPEVSRENGEAAADSKKERL